MEEQIVRCQNCSETWTDMCNSACPVCMSHQKEVVKERHVINTNFSGTDPIQWVNSISQEIESLVDEGYTFDKERRGFIYFKR